MKRGQWGAMLAAVVLATAGGGCAVGPDYKQPAPVAGAEVPLVSTTPSVETVAEPPDDWWRLYHDATLDKLLEEAFAANTDLRIATANIFASRAILQAAKTERYPQPTVAILSRKRFSSWVGITLKASGCTSARWRSRMKSTSSATSAAPSRRHAPTLPWH